MTNQNPQTNGLLAGVKVVEAAVRLAGEYLGLLLAEEGADVTKVETPGSGDWIRDHMGAIALCSPPYDLFVNSNKRNLSHDMKHGESRGIFERLISDADVFVTGFTRSVPTRMGMGVGQIGAINRDVIYAQITGFGADGPSVTLPTHVEMMHALVSIPQRVPAVRRFRRRLSLVPAHGSGNALQRRASPGNDR